MKFRKVLSILLIAFVLTAVFPITAAAFDVTNDVELISAENSTVITVGYSEITNNFIDDIDSLNNKGYGYEVFKKLEEISDLQFEFVPIEGDLQLAVERGDVDVAGFDYRTDERAEEVLFSNIQFSKTYVALMTNDPNAIYNDPQSIDGKTVATYLDNIAQANLDLYCEQNGISVNYIYGSEDNYMDLEADYYIAYAQHDGLAGKTNALNLGVFNLYLMTSFENSDIMARIEAVFLQIISSEGNFFLELEERYLAGDVDLNHRSLNPQEVALLQQRPLEVGYIADYPPISFIDDNGEPSGTMIDIMNLFSELYSFEVNYHPYSLTDDRSQHENFDILLTIYGDDQHIAEYYDTTETFYQLPMFAQVQLDIYRQGSTGAEVSTEPLLIGMLPYQGVDYELFAELFPSYDIVLYNDWHQMLDDFDAGRLDTIISTEASSTYASLYLSNTEKISVSTALEIPMRLLISKTISDEYLPVFNVLQDTVTNGEYQSILSNNSISFLPANSFWDYATEYWPYLLLIIVFALFAFFAYAYRQQKKQREVITAAYNTDELTGFMTMRKFNEALEATLLIAQPGEYKIVSLDVDMFKTINTHYSNDKGTEIITAIATALKDAFTDNHVYISRRTADQFLILKRIVEDESIALVYEQYILPRIRAVIGENYNITMSFGSVVIDDCTEKSSTLIAQADNARLRGKDKHQTTFIVFDAAMKKLYDDKVNFTFRMEQALKDKEFFVVYQPKINFNTLKVNGAEALVRWQPQQGGPIFPDAFIPVFEENGFISALDLYVLEETCLFIKSNQDKMAIPCISVNLSAYTVLDDTIVEKISAIIQKYNIHPYEIELEITESAVVGEKDKFLSKIRKLKTLGCLIAIDDFGAGVSSLNRLSTVDADILKLDKVFFSLQGQGGKSAVVVQDVISMAKHLHMSVVAEGVETYEQALWLKSVDCDYAQGYYFERPMSEDAFRELLLSGKQYELMG